MGRIVPSALSDILKYVAANPYRILGLAFGLFESILGGGNTPFAGAYPHSKPEKTLTSLGPFRTLPNELINIVLFQLMPKDIENIRSVSRSFHQLPGYLFMHLIKRHMPWFWEAGELENWVEASWSKISESDIRGRTTNINWVRIYQHMLVLQGAH